MCETVEHFGGRRVFYEGIWSVEPKRHLATRLLNLLLLNLLLLHLLLNYSRGAPFPKGESPSRILGGLSLQKKIVIGGLGYMTL